VASFSLAIQGDLRKHVEAIAKAQKRAATTETRRSTTTLKNAVRRVVIRQGGLGQGVANAVRDEVFPARGVSSDPKGRVVSKAIYKRPGGLIDLLTVFIEGAIITARGEFLLIGGRKIGKVAGGKARRALAKVVKILPRLKGIETEHARVSAALPDNYARAFERELAKGA
jgi:hypothetical protein